MSFLKLLTLFNIILIASCIDVSSINYDDWEEAVAECTDAFHCDFNNPQLVKDLYMCGGPEFTKLNFKWMKELAHYDVPYDGSLEYFGNYSKHMCDMPKEERREISKKYYDVGYEFYMEHCASQTAEECVKFMNYLWENQVIGMKYFAQGHCQGLAKLLPLPEEMKQLAAVTSKAVNAAKNLFKDVTNIFG
ncbi:hypothetical protein JTE90_008837 [Oedothorax gibbosus]|uniref:Uncharacterized protein n=1 Tax=Oedothorax gibbosus TaxID=931172 RepID=A0AAV6UA34_9ARAC|nr:hypothetical protein JTE90_008837 [Oedothorax gibbosus]